MLATRISFMNELANLAETLGADIEKVRQRHRLATRASATTSSTPAPATAARCFPKDVKALQRTRARGRHGRCACSPRSSRSTTRRSACSSRRSSRASATTCTGKRFALWGLAFKPNTDDMREAPSRALIDDAAGAPAPRSRAYDPVAMDEAQRIFGERDRA